MCLLSALSGALYMPRLLPSATILSTLERRQASNCVKAATGSSMSRRQTARQAASSIASEAPCPELGEIAWAASPISTALPSTHLGTVGTSYIGNAETSGVALIRSLTNWGSSLNVSSNSPFHSQCDLSLMLCRVGSDARPRLANHQAWPFSRTV